MKFTFPCPECGAKLDAQAAARGRPTHCRSCSTRLPVPEPTVGPGTLLGGFRIMEQLGEGGMGRVFLATQLSMDRLVAVKVIAAALLADPQFVERFLREVRTTAKLNHPNIVIAHEAGEDDGFYYLAMAYVDGLSLADRIKAEGRLGECEALRIAGQVAAGLQYAWAEHGVLHRDVKPANIMQDRHGNAKVMDLGLARNVADSSQLTVTGITVGTPHYMSPEQAKCLPDIDFRTDIYSLGATLYHLVTGTHPYTGASAAEVLAKHLRDPLPPPQQRNMSLSDACTRLLQRTMAKDRDHRHQSWEAVIEDIDHALQAPRPRTPTLPDTVVGTVPMSQAQEAETSGAHSQPARSRRRTVALAIASLTLAMAALLAWLNRDTTATDNSRLAHAPTGTPDQHATDSVVPPRQDPEPPDAVVAPEPRPAPRTSLSQMLRTAKVDLLRLNPGLQEKEITFEPSPRGMSLTLAHNRSLSDISPLTGLPLVAIDIQGTSVFDLEPLRGMPCSELRLGTCPVSDLDPLSDCPLTQLFIQSTNVTDLSPLTALRLERLWIGGTKVRDLTPLQGMPLTELSAGTTLVSDISPLRGMPLKSLHLHCCPRLHDLSPLDGMETLEYLNIPEQCRDIEFLRHLPNLKWLKAERGAAMQSVEVFWRKFEAQRRGE